MAFSPDEIERYDRQTRLPEWGASGQERVRASSVEVRGRGPAAEAAALYLAGAGVGRLFVEPALVERARALNPLVEVVALSAISPRVPVPGQPDPDPPQPSDPEHPDEAAPDQPQPELPVPEEPAVALTGSAMLHCSDDRTAAGCALALETLKSILGLSHRTRVRLELDPP